MESDENRNFEMSEYSALRAEIISKQEKKIEVWLHMYILFVTLFTLGIETDNRYLLLLTYLIIIPYQVMLNNCEWNVSRISTYIHIFYEENNSVMKWESFNKYYTKYTDYLHKKTAGFMGFIRQAGSIHLALLATGFYIWKTLDNKLIEQLDGIDWMTIVLSVLLLVITIYINNPDEIICDEELVIVIKDFKKEKRTFDWTKKKPGWRKRMTENLKSKLKL